jgi:transcription initiation factor TFIIE subunit alpha
VQYLDSLNDYRKRSRSKEDEGAAATKLSKIDVPELEPNVTDSMMEVNGADDTPVFGGFLFFTSKF